jgi:TolB-like protein
MKTFFQELKKRRVYRVAIFYGLVASGAVQLGGTVLPAFNAPVWTQQVFLVALALGFPVALILAWAFDLTSTGIQRTPSATGLHVVRTQQMWLLGAAGLLIAGVALAGYWFWHPWRNPSLAGSSPMSDQILEKGIAVLPFENLSVEPSNAFFTEGVQEQILTDLAKVADLKVISRTSVASYKTDRSRNLREIGSAVGCRLHTRRKRPAGRKRECESALNSSTPAPTRICGRRVTTELADVFALQSEIAEAIVYQPAPSSHQKKKRASRNSRLATWPLTIFLFRAPQIVNSHLMRQTPPPRSNRRFDYLREPWRVIRVSSRLRISRGHTVFFTSSILIQPARLRAPTMPSEPPFGSIQILAKRISPRPNIISRLPRLQKRDGRAGDRAGQPAQQRVALSTARLFRATARPLAGVRTKLHQGCPARSAQHQRGQFAGRSLRSLAAIRQSNRRL